MINLINLYDYVLNFENLNAGKLCIFRMGFFYCSFGIQSFLPEERLGLVRTCFIPEKVCKVGIPKDAFNKYMMMLKSNNISFCVFDYVLDNDGCDFEYNGKKYRKTIEYDSGDNCDFSKYSINCNMCKYKKNNIYQKLDMIEKILLSIKSGMSGEDKNEINE